MRKSRLRFPQILFILLISLIGIGLASAETSVWKLAAGEQHFYIAGSLHMLRKADYPLPPEFETAYQNADIIMFETALSELEQPAYQQQLLQKGLYPEGKNLKQSLPEKTYAKLTEYCQANDLPLENLEQMKPWMLVLSLTIAELYKHGIQPNDGIEAYYNRKAQQDGKKTAGLVPVAEHINMLASLETGFDNLLIESFFHEMKTLIPLMEDLTEAWRMGKENTINTLINDLIHKDYPELHQKILLNRNERWLSTIETQIRSKQNTLIIVGVGHLVGKGSVIDLLRAKGYKLEKLNVSAKPQ